MGEQRTSRMMRSLRLPCAVVCCVLLLLLLLVAPLRSVVAQSSSGMDAMSSGDSTGDWIDSSTAEYFDSSSADEYVDSSSSAVDEASSSAMEQPSSSAMDVTSSSAMDVSSSAMDAGSSAMDASSAAQEMSSTGEVMMSSSATEQSSSAAMDVSSSAMDASSSAVEAPSSSAMDASSSAMDAASSSAAMIESSSAMMEMSSSAELLSSAMDSSSAVMIESSSAMSAMEMSSSADSLSSAMDSSSAVLLESSSAMDSTAAAMAGSSSAMDSSSAAVAALSSMESSSASSVESSSAMAMSSSAPASASSSAPAMSASAAQVSSSASPVASSTAVTPVSSSAAMQLSSSAPGGASSGSASMLSSSGVVRVASSSTGARVALSSTGTVSPTVVIPESLPVFQLSLSIKRAAMSTFTGGLQSFVTQLRSDIASVCSVRAARVLLLRLEDQAGTTSLLDFTIADSLVSSDQSPRAAGTLLFGSLIGNGASIIVSAMPALVYMVSNSLQLASNQAAITPDLPYVRLGLQYQIDSLPGGSSVAFSQRLLVDLARACGVPSSRITVQRLVAGSVYAYFIIAPQMAITEPTALAARDNFQAQAENATSPLYVGSDVTSATIFGSALFKTVADPPANPPATVVTEDDSFWNSSKRVGTVFGIAIAVIIGGAILLALLWYFVLSKKKDNIAVTSYDHMETQKANSEMTGISVHTPSAQPQPLAPMPPPAYVARPPPAAAAPAADAKDVHFTLAAGGYGSVRNLHAKPAETDDDHAHFELSDDVAAQPYFKGAQGAPAVGPRPTVQSVIDRHAPPSTLQRAQSTSAAQSSPVSSGPAPPGSPSNRSGNPIVPLGQARSPGSFRISFSKQQRPLPSMLPRAATLASPGSNNSSSAPRASASPVAAPYSPSAYNAPPAQLPPPQRQMQPAPYTPGQSSGAAPAVPAYSPAPSPQPSPYSLTPAPAPAPAASSTAASDAQLRMKLRKAAAKQGGGPATPADAYASEYPAQPRR